MWYRGRGGGALRIASGVVVATAAIGLTQATPARAATAPGYGLGRVAAPTSATPRYAPGGIGTRLGIVFWHPELAPNREGTAEGGSSAWAVQPSPNVTAVNGDLLSVSCSSTDACVGVGYDTDLAGRQQMLVEKWDGESWTTEAAAKPQGALDDVLAGVSCAASDACIAVGALVNSFGATVALAEQWNGEAWSVLTAPKVHGAVQSSLSGVSCSASDACTSVGSFLGLSAPGTLAERWNGKSWTVETMPSPPGGIGGSLSAVSCSAASACTAVGSSSVGTLAEVWNGASWKIQLTPNPTFSFLSGVSCRASNACIAVGAYTNSRGNQVTLAETWDGTAWATQSTPNAKRTGLDVLAGVSCSADAACTAVGSDSSGVLAESWDGSSWTLQSAANPGGQLAAMLTGVSCPAIEMCAAVGSGLDSYGVPVTLAEAGQGSSWTVESTPNRLGSLYSSLDAVSCSSSGSCMAVGSTSSASLAESWNGASWRIVPTPNPAGSFGGLLSSVSCTAVNACVAVGSYFGSAGPGALAESWNGVSWRIDPAPIPAGSFGGLLYGVSCTAADACVAVGTYLGSAGQGTLAESWNGVSWSIVPTPNPAGSISGLLAEVSCVSAGACEAVGNYTNSGGMQVSLAEGWNGASWEVQSTPNPTGAAATILVGVSCTAADLCIAAGGHLTPANVSKSLAETWDGTTWKIQAMPNPVGSTYTLPIAVSCAAAGSCTAVGSYNDSLGVQQTLADGWNGTAWEVQATANPPGAFATNLQGVSCTAVMTCTAVGASFDNTGFASTLAEAET